MDILLKYTLFISLILSSCGKKSESSISDKTVKSVLFTKPVISESYTPKSPCHCNDDGTSILNEILIERKKFKSIESLQDNNNAKNYIELLQKNWDTIRWRCLKTFGTRMFTPSDCNDPDNIQNIKDKLLKLDIST